jgi:hypothetical protein
MYTHFTVQLYNVPLKDTNIKLLKYRRVVMKMVETFVIEIKKVERHVAAKQVSPLTYLLINYHS